MSTVPAIKELVEIITTSAKNILLPAFGKVSSHAKADGSLVTQADLDMHTQVETSLRQRYPDIRFLSEEMPAEIQQRLMRSNEPLWVLDPLDGTSNFAYGIPIFAVSLALLQDGEVKLGIVYDPVREECFSVRSGEKSQINGQDIPLPVVPDSLDKTMAIIDFKRLPAHLSDRIVNDMPYASQRSFGSGALDWCWLAAGRGHIYLHGRQNVWDYVAGQMILKHAYGDCCTLEGGPVFHGQLNASSVVAATTPALYQDWRSYIIG